MNQKSLPRIEAVHGANLYAVQSTRETILLHEEYDGAKEPSDSETLFRNTVLLAILEREDLAQREMPIAANSPPVSNSVKPDH